MTVNPAVIDALGHIPYWPLAVICVIIVTGIAISLFCSKREEK